MTTVTEEAIANAGTDLQSIYDVVNGSSTFGGTGVVTTRLSTQVKTLAKVMADLEVSGAAATALILGATAFTQSLFDDVDEAAARTTLGIGTIAPQDANAVTITGGTIVGITDLAVADGGTGSSTAAGARTNLGVVAATSSASGLVELATSAETIAGTDTTRAVTPADLIAWYPAHAYAAYTSSADLTTVIPEDDTVPTVTEGTQILSVTITPKRVTNKIHLRFSGQFAGYNYQNAAIALFRSSTCVAAKLFRPSDNTGTYNSNTVDVTLDFEECPATTSAVTYTLRAGPCTAARVLRANGIYTARRLGGVALCTLTADEIYA